MGDPWGWAQADVAPGTYEAFFEINGGLETVGGFDDISLRPGECYYNSEFYIFSDIL